MCFVNDDYDWCAMVNEEADITTSTLTTCDECGQKIPVGSFAHTIHQQEHEECQACENGECECQMIDDEPICNTVGCRCAEPDLGESFDYVRCESCDKFLKAIEAAEIEEGCAVSESRPAMPMWDDLAGIGRGEVKRYWKKAAKMFPELVGNGHLALLWKRCW